MPILYLFLSLLFYFFICLLKKTCFSPTGPAQLQPGRGPAHLLAVPELPSGRPAAARFRHHAVTASASVPPTPRLDLPSSFISAARIPLSPLSPPRVGAPPLPPDLATAAAAQPSSTPYSQSRTLQLGLDTSGWVTYSIVYCYSFHQGNSD